jgi:glycosyltransferase involved in cell wall biosynthesis
MTSLLRPLRILWTSPNFPWPTTNGGKLRQVNLMRQLAHRGHKSTLFSLAKEMPRPEDIGHLETFLDRVIVITRRPATHPAVLLAAGLSLDRPVAATVNGLSALYEQEADRLLAESWDIIQCEHTYGFEPLERPLRRHRKPFFLTEHNVESTVVATAFERFPAAVRPLQRLDAIRYRRWERRVIRQADCVIAVTDQDAEAFRHMGAQHTATVVNCIDTESFAHTIPQPLARRLLFLGNFEYPPNVDAVTWLNTEIMPQVWATAPDVSLTIAGHATPKAWRKRWLDPRIEFVGYLPSVRDAHAAASVFVAPIRSGGGSKLKVLEAMAAGTPIVATSEAVSGLAVRPGLEHVGGDTLEEMTAGIRYCLENPHAAFRMGQQARNYAVKHHDWSVGTDALERAYLMRRPDLALVDRQTGCSA